MGLFPIVDRGAVHVDREKNPLFQGLTLVDSEIDKIMILLRASDVVMYGQEQHTFSSPEVTKEFATRITSEPNATEICDSMFRIVSRDLLSRLSIIGGVNKLLTTVPYTQDNLQYIVDMNNFARSMFTTVGTRYLN